MFLGGCGLVMGWFAGVVMGGAGMHFLYSPVFGDQPINYQTIYFPEAGERIHTVARIWGITGNHEEVRLCSRPFEFGKRDQTSECLVFHTDRIYYKKDGGTSLRVFAPGSSIPPGISTSVGKVRVSVKELKTYDEIRNFEQNFEHYGLSTLSAP